MMADVIQQIPWAALTVVVPLVAAAASFLAASPPVLRIIHATAVLSIVGSVAALAWSVWLGGPVRHDIGGWASPLGIALYGDGLSVLMLSMTALVGAAVSVHSFYYFPAGVTGQRRFWPLWLFLWAALNGLFLSRDVFNLYVTLEVMGIAAVALVAMAGSAESLVAGMRYFFVAVLGSLAYLMGVAILYSKCGALDMDAISGALDPGQAATSLAAALMLTGMLAKTALFPMHFWLPRAHASAPAPVSAVLSALVVKASFYIMLRLWTDVFPAGALVEAGVLLGALGAGAIIWGGAMALRQRTLKLLVAYSTVSQIGYLFLFFPMSGMEDAFTGSVFQALAHSLAKAAMFLAAGNFLVAFGHDRIEGLSGFTGRLQVSVFSFGLAGASLMGLPPSGGFIAKWQLLKASLQSGQWWWAAVVIAGGLLAAAYIFPVIRVFFKHTGNQAECKPVPWIMEGAALALALLSIALGLASAVPMHFIAGWSAN